MFIYDFTMCLQVLFIYKTSTFNSLYTVINRILLFKRMCLFIDLVINLQLVQWVNAISGDKN